MPKEFQQLEWDAAIEDDLRQLVRLAVREDLAGAQDWTTLALVPEDAQGRAALVVREEGVVAGLRAAEMALEEMNTELDWQAQVDDGALVAAGTRVADVAGPARDILTSERIILNLVGRMSGIATRTRKFVESVAGTAARIYDTRKTTPGWRRLEKYAVRCGGGHNHRTGLYDAILIKDNHLALGAAEQGGFSPAEAVRRVRSFIEQMERRAKPAEDFDSHMIIEVEVDDLDQLEEVLPLRPDVVLLDNMSPDALQRAVSLRGRLADDVQLEASGGITLQAVRSVATSGVTRISVGSLTHAAASLDVGLDWRGRGTE